MHLVPDNNHHARRGTSEWVLVAETTMWADRLELARAEDNETEPYGWVAVSCYRHPRTNLETAPFLLSLFSGDKAVSVPCTREEVRALALELLEAAQHACPRELRRAGYDIAVAPWFEAEQDNDGGAA